MAARKNTATITPSVFKAVKILLKSGATQKEVAEYMSISEASVQKIKASEDYDDYKRIVNAWWAKKKAAEEKKRAAEEKPAEEKEPEKGPQIIEHRQNVTIQATHYMMEKMKKTNELLTLINNKLGAIIDDLYGVKNNA